MFRPWLPLVLAVYALVGCATPDVAGVWDGRAELHEVTVVPPLASDVLQVRPPRQLEVELQIDDEVVVLDLHRNDRLFAPDYVEASVTTEGDWFAPSPGDRADAQPCWYQGWTDRGGVVALRACDPRRGMSFSGLVEYGGRLHALQVLESGDASVFAPVEDGAGDDGVAEVPWSSTVRPGGSLLEDGQCGPDAGARVELMVVHDAARVASRADAVVHAADVLNAADALFRAGGFATPVQLTLAGQVAFEGRAPFEVSPEADTVSPEALLDRFTDWRPHPDWLKFDHGLLLSGREFERSKIGAAWQDGMCTSHSRSAVQATHHVGKDAVSVAHEIAHSLGAVHDGAEGAEDCPTVGYVMAPKNGGPNRATWSACALDAVDAFVCAPTAACLRD